MSIENQIAVHADEPEQLSANEILVLLLDGRSIYIGGELCSLFDIKEKINIESLKQLAEDVLFDDKIQIRELYIKTIQEMME